MSAPSTPPRRCDCCDGPDDLGYHHVVGVDALRAALAAGLDGPIDVEYGKVRWDQFDNAVEAEQWLDEWDEHEAEAAADERRGMGLRW